MTLPVSQFASRNVSLISNNLQPEILQSTSPASFERELGKIQASSSEPKLQNASLKESKVAPPEKDELREAFQNFVGQTFFNQMLSSMRSTQREPAYFHGGQAEKIFQGQLDQILSEEMTKASASQIADPMYDLFRLSRQ